MLLNALPYHLKVRDHFKQQKKTWDFFALSANKSEQLSKYKTELLKNTYKFDEASDSRIYDKVREAKEKLGLENLKVTVYQAQYTDELNASVLYLETEALIVFSGRIIQLLDDAELLAVIAHELTHVKLYVMMEGDLEIADRIITAIANNQNSETSHYETARLFRLYTEIFCDRGAYTVLNDISPIITSLVKIATGLDQINAQNYVKQAEEIFSSEENTKASQVTHPENFIRARSIHLWHENKEIAEDAIAKMIEGVTDIDQIDIFRQKELADFTRSFLQLFLKPKWFQSTMVISHAKQYFKDFTFNEKAILNKEFSEKIEKAHKSVKDYFSYVLLDFSLIDKTLEEIPMGWSFQFSEDLYLKETFDSIVKKELKFSDKKLQQYKQKTLGAYYEVKENDSEQIYDT